MIFRLYFQQKGNHVHCRLFAGKAEGALGKCGDLTFRVEEFNELFRIGNPARIPNGGTHFLPREIDIRPEPN